MDPLVMAFGTALVGAMATDAWGQVRDGVVGLWRRVCPEQAEVVEAELEGVRGQVLEARDAGAMEVEQALAGVWQGRMQQLVLEDSAVAVELRRLVEEVLAPVLTAAEQARIGPVVMSGRSEGHSTFNQVAGNQINYRS